jgi:hypothetical protein
MPALEASNASGRAVFFQGGAGALGKDFGSPDIKSCSESTLRTTRPHARRTQGSAPGLEWFGKSL